METKVGVARAPPPAPLVECSTPYTSAPSSPQRPLNLFFYSAPTTPNNNPSFFSGDHLSLLSSSVPFQWEILPGVPKPSTHDHVSSSSCDDYQQQQQRENDNDESFEFDFSGQLDTMVRPSLSSADELFDGGIIRPFKPPPHQQNISSPIMSRFIKDALSLSPRYKMRPKPQSDTFQAAPHCQLEEEDGGGRGRRRGKGAIVAPTVSNNTNMNSRVSSVKRGYSRKGISRSLSPLRVSEFALLHSNDQQLGDSHAVIDKTSLASSSRGGSKKWRLKDLFLFRSASEGRATGGNSKDPLRKYFAFTRRNFSDEDAEDPKNGSFRSSTSGGPMSKRRGGGQGKISAHEMHYTSKRAVTEDLKKKTTLPYKHGLLGCLGFTPLLEDLSKAFGSFSPS